MGFYTRILRPILFKVDPETTHNLALQLGKFCGNHKLTRWLLCFLYNYKNKKLHIAIKGIKFDNPIGLAAGFDKNALLTNIIPCIGFGFMEVGSITGEPCEGNPKPRIFRLPKDKALVVNYGLCNDGAEITAKRLRNKRFKIPLGINIAKTNDKKIKGQASIEDYYKAYSLLKNTGSYITINISCPNTGDGRSFEDPFLLEKLLNKIGKTDKIIFLKISPDLSYESINQIIKLGEKYHVSGFIVANLTHDRTGLISDKKKLVNIKGSVSGPQVRKKTDELIKHVYKKTQGKFIIIGVGGVFTAEDAYQKIKNGASLVQLITGMIYKGPSVVKNINRGLVKLIKRDGFRNIQEVIGADARKEKVKFA